MRLPPLHGLSGQIFLWFWSMLLLILAVVISLPSLDPRNTIPLPPKERISMQQHVRTLLQGARPDQAFDLQQALQAAGLMQVGSIYVRDQEGQVQASTPPDKFVMRFMLEVDQPDHPMMGRDHNDAVTGPFLLEHNGHSYQVYFGLNVDNPYLFLVIQILDHPVLILLVAMLISTPLCLLLALRLTRPIQQLQQSVSQIAAGELETRIPNLERRDEIGQLADNVSHMVETLKLMIQKQKQLLSDISHELRSPLTRIQLAQSLIRRKQGDSNELARIESEIGRLDKLIGDLLDLSRAQQRVEAPLQHSLAELLEPILDDALFEANQSGKRLIVPPLPSLSLRMWPELLARALENPLRNALKYADSLIEVEWHSTAQHWTMSIRDDGAGVPSEQLALLFQPFYRVDDARNSQTGGTGLGLAIAAEAVRRHGGHITAAHNAPHGLLITITLPLT